MLRGTFKINNSNSLNYINKNYLSLNKVSSQIALQQQVVNLEDDPLSANIGIKMLNVISKSQQYSRNLKSGIDSLNFVDGKLATAKTSLQKINDLVITGAQDTNNASQRATMASEISELLKSLVGVGNSNDGNRYVFGGQNTTSAPFTIVNSRYVNYTGNNKPINIVVDNDTTMATNTTGSDIYGNMTTTIPSKDMNPDISLLTDHSTKLSDLNGGAGVPKGKVMVYYSAYPDGLEVDLSGCDTMEDVKDAIEQQTLEASRDLNTAEHPWLDATTLDWHDLQDRYVKVTLNPDHNGISLQEIDMGEPLPEPNALEKRRGLDYSGGNYAVGSFGSAGSEGAKPVFNLTDPNGRTFANLRVDDVAGNKVAEGLGIKGSANTASGDRVMDGYLHGRDLNPRLSGQTLLADLEGYNDSTYTFTNGAKPGNISVNETSQDPNKVFNDWNLNGITIGDNTGPNGELYARAVNNGDEIIVEIYSCPIDKAKSGDLVASGVYKQTATGGTVVLEEANSSGVSGSVGIVLPYNAKTSEASVNLSVDLGDSYQASVHVPAFIEESENGRSRDVLNIASGWNIKGLDKPPALGYDLNHPASTDLDGNVSVNYRYDADNKSFIVELSRPAYDNQPAALIATGSLYVGDAIDPNDPDALTLAQSASGRIEFKGAEGFENISGSVFIELPHGTTFTGSDASVGTAANPTGNTYQLAEDFDTMGETVTVYFGGATELTDTLVLSQPSSFQLTADTVFKKGQVFENDIPLPGGGRLKAGTPLDRDMTLNRGANVVVSQLEAGTILSGGTTLPMSGTLPAGTVIPRGSFIESASGMGFPSSGMGISNGATGVNPLAGFDLTATFATVEDFTRAVQEKGIYVTAEVSSDGKGLEFKSSLAGAYLTVSEDTDCYEQMGDINNQLTALDLTGLVKGTSADRNGNVHTEVIYYPLPAPVYDSEGNIVEQSTKVQLVADSGEVYEIEAGYYVRVYSDQDQLNHLYENRDNSSMVAEGFVPAGEWNPAWLASSNPAASGLSPFIPDDGSLGTMEDMVLEERNDSGVSGRVDLNYYGNNGNPIYEMDAEGKPVYDIYNNDNITVYPGGLRPTGSAHTTIQEVDLYQPTPGVNCDYQGTVHGKIFKSADGLTTTVQLYKDSSHSVMTAKGVINGDTGKVTFYETEKNGKYVVDSAKLAANGFTLTNYNNMTDAEKNNYHLEAGSMYVAENELPDDATNTFSLKTGANRNAGQEREENVFSTINDILDALHRGDSDALHNLLGDIEEDVLRVSSARSEVGARAKRMELLYNRHGDDQINYQSTFNSRVGMDDQALARAVMDFQASTEAFQAAMQVSSQIMQMSLLQYI